MRIADLGLVQEINAWEMRRVNRVRNGGANRGNR